MEKFDKVRKLIREIEDAAADGDYIYRGEDKDYGKVSSSFYREYFEDTGFYLTSYKDGFVDQVFEEKVVREATMWEYPEGWRYYEAYDELPHRGGHIGSIWKEQHVNTMSALQHYGGKTNLIDFTKDPLVALYFACDGAPNEIGRVILLQATIGQGTIVSKPWIPWESEYDPRGIGDADVRVWEPNGPEVRVGRQKSVFVQPRNGFFDPRNTIPIPKEDKKNVLAYLEAEYNIGRKHIYGDLHGFVKYQSAHKDEVMESEDVLRCLIDKYSESIKCNPTAQLYCCRGFAHSLLEELDEAINDFGKSIRIQPTREAYYYRASAFIKKGGQCIEDAKRDLAFVIRLPLSMVDGYWDDMMTSNGKSLIKDIHGFRGIIRLVQEAFPADSIANPLPFIRNPSERIHVDFD